MSREKIREKIDEIKSKISLIEWDKKTSGTLAKEHIYKELKRQYKELKAIEKRGYNEGKTKKE